MVYISEKLKHWIVSHFSNEAVIHHVHPLKGSTTAVMYTIRLQLSSGESRELVLRQYEKSSFTAKDIEQEADSLKAAASLAVETPQYIAADPGGEITGKPLLLMSKVEGKINILPENQSEWLSKLAETLAQIHDNSIIDFHWQHERYQKADEIEIPAWSGKQEVWRALKEIVMQPDPSYTPRFIHRDFHPVNVLWKNNEVSGVVDWANGCVGHAGIDVGHCRWNLAMLYGVEAADVFLTAYQKKFKDDFSYDVYWDIVSLMDVLEGQPDVYPGWGVFGKKDITVEMMKERMDCYAVSLLEKTDEEQEAEGEVMDFNQLNTQTKNQLVILRELQTLFEKHKLQMWVKGGWAIDFLLGKATRPHEDIDLVTWIQNRECIEAELVKARYKRIAVKEPFCNRQSDFQKNNVDLSISYITYHSNSSLIMNGLPEWIWRADSLLDKNFLLDNITVKVIHPKQLLEEKEVYKEIGRPYRQKDEESKKILRSILSEWDKEKC